MAPNQKPLACQGCPAFRTGKGFVRPSGPVGARLVLLGSGPSSDEYLDGTPFTGFVGQKLDYWLSRVGLDRSKVALGHVVQCQLPYENGSPREPHRTEYEFCREAHWGKWLAASAPDSPPDGVLVTLGIGAAKAILGRGTKARDMGNLTGPPWVMPIQSPQYVANGNWNEEPAQIEFLRYVKEILDGKPPERPNFDLPPPGVQFTQSPTLADLDEFRNKLGPEGLVIDLETAGDHLRLVGLLDITSLRYVGFPVRTVGGGSYWQGDDLTRAAEWLWDLLSDPTVGKCFHNGSAFDIPMLERNGFIVNGYSYDTMLAQHVAYPGTPKGLEELSKVYLRSGGWKSLVKVDEESGEGK